MRHRSAFSQAICARECIAWLESNGRVTVFDTTESLYDGVNDPATQMIGVLSDGDGIKTILSGDELRDKYRYR